MKSVTFAKASGPQIYTNLNSTCDQFLTYLKSNYIREKFNGPFTLNDRDCEISFCSLLFSVNVVCLSFHRESDADADGLPPMKNQKLGIQWTTANEQVSIDNRMKLSFTNSIVTKVRSFPKLSSIVQHFIISYLSRNAHYKDHQTLDAMNRKQIEFSSYPLRTYSSVM